MNVVSGIFTILVGAGTVQGLFIAGVLFAGRKKGGRANVILAALTLVFSFNIAHTVYIGEAFGFSGKSPLVVFEPFQLLFGPLIFLYVRSLTGEIHRPFVKDLRHFLPFLVSALVALSHSVLGSYPGVETLRRFGVIGWAAVVAHLAAYVAATLILTARHDRLLRGLSSSDSGSIDWIKGFLFLFLAISVLYFTLLILMMHRIAFPYFRETIALCLSASVYGIGFVVLTRTPASIAPSSDIPAAKNVSPAYDRTGLTEEEAGRLSSELQEFMVRKKPYLDPELTLPGLADLCAISRNKLSRVINGTIGKSFYDFINEYRVEEFKNIASDPSRAPEKVLSLAMDSGFNSKPAFNSVFKRMTGVTPSDFRKAAAQKR